LQATAAWRDENGTRYGGYYTQEEVKDVVAYAAKRFINIIPEIEMPGHSCAALAAYPSLGCTGGPYKVQPSWGIFKDVYCAGNDSVFTFLQGVIDEVVQLFPSQYIHVGGDETPKDSWKQCAKCQARMKKEGLKDEHELQSYFVQRMEKYINSKGRKLIGWDEILEGGLAPNATVMSWRGEKGGIEASRQKHDVIMSPYTYLYFDYYQGKPATEPKAIGGYLPLPAVYAYEPLSAGFTKEDHSYVKGIQANTWTEFIADEKHLDYMVFPRALIVAETGWGPPVKNYDGFMKKLRVRLQALDKQPINFRIPEPLGLKDSITDANTIDIDLQPSVQGATVYYSIDGTEPNKKLSGTIKLSLATKEPVILKTVTVLPSGRKSAVYAASYKKANTRIEWDTTTLRKVSAADKRNSGYARLIVLPDNSWLCTYEADGSVVVTKSTDKGQHWSDPVMVAERGNGYNMSVPDLLLLKDGSILIGYNPRPFEISPDRKFAIRTKKSYDGGATWKDERLLYEAGHEFKNGCWEPCALQLPGGEIQLYFANEGPYTTSEEQNISMLRSADNGLTWTSKPTTVSFRAGSRDGMPVPVLLNNGKEIVFAIEDNGIGNFKPYIIRNTLKENWLKPVFTNSTSRQYALSEKIADSIYAGAPYLRQLPSGETILSYQGTEDRPNKMRNAEMKVVIGSSTATNFGKKSSPFPIPPSKSGLWNSLSVIDNNTVVALTSTNAFTNNRGAEVWMIIGRVKR
jgi:hypothetical protein